jgi:hypothetical protein
MNTDKMPLLGAASADDSLGSLIPLFIPICIHLWLFILGGCCLPSYLITEKTARCGKISANPPE